MKIYALTLILALSFSQLKAQTTITFNGTDNKVNVPKNGDGVMNGFSTPHDFTIEIRFKFNSTPSGAIFSKHAPPANGFFIEIKDGKIHSGMGYNGDYSTITGSTLSANQFYHAALSYQVSSNSFKLYLDGALVNTQTISSSYVPNVDNNISIGSSDHWGGAGDLTIDYFRIWDIQKSDTDIANNKGVEVDCSSTNLLLQYRFDNTTTLNDGDTVVSCTDSNNGTFYGSPQILSNENINLSQKITFYPNPSTKFIQVSGLSKTENYIIYNALGLEVANGKVAVDNTAIDVSNLAPSVYIVRVFNDESSFSQKIVIE